MKKTLVALAAIAATASFAQSSVSITGNLDFAYSSGTGTLASALGSTISTGRGTSSTSGIKLTAIEDLGGGMKLTAQYELDPRAIADDTATQVFNQNNSAANSANTPTTSSTLKMLGTHEIFVGLSGGFGNLQLGQPNSFGLTTHGASSPLGTGIGSGYTANGAGSTLWSKLTSTRYARSAKYTSPNMGGLTVGVLYAPGNDQSVTVGTTTALTVLNGRQVTEIGVNYSKGDLNVSFTNLQQAAQTNALGYYGSGTANGVATNANVLAANYKIGNLTAYLGMGSGRTISVSSTESTQSQSRGALKYTMGNIDLIGQYTSVESASSSTNSGKATVTGVRVDYNLSKTGAAYLGYEAYDSGATTANQLNLVSVGLRKSF